MYITTKSGTLRKGDVEYNQEPPDHVVKAMSRRHADDLVNYGTLRLFPFEYYQHLESDERGDKNEGRGLLRLGDHDLQAGSAHALIFCSALPSVKRADILRLSENYDTVVRISDIHAFGSLVVEAIGNAGLKSYAHCGIVQYNRGRAVDRGDLANLKWHFSAFQKDELHSKECEYRFVFSILAPDELRSEYLHLNETKAGKLISIEKAV